MKRKGNILAENLIFIILNLAFIGIVILFISLRAGESVVLEEVYAKQIALMIDAAKPGMIISMNIEEGIERLGKEKGKKPEELIKEEIENTININRNTVVVKLRGGEVGYSYSFFNNVSVNNYFDSNNKEMIFVILKNENK